MQDTSPLHHGHTFTQSFTSRGAIFVWWEETREPGGNPSEKLGPVRRQIDFAAIINKITYNEQNYITQFVELAFKRKHHHL